MVYKRILLKLSGEILGTHNQKGIDYNQLAYYTKEIKQAHALGVRMAIVVGGGNIHRSSQNLIGLDPVASDQIGMLATMMNGIALQNDLEKNGVPSLHMSSLHFPTMFHFYTRSEALEALERGVVVIITGGLCLPYFTTDTAASLRGIELGVDVMLKATNVDGVYNTDPKIDPTATRFEQLTFQEAIEKNLAVLDRTAFVLCQTHHLPLIVFNAMCPNGLSRIIQGEPIGTMVGVETTQKSC